MGEPSFGKGTVQTMIDLDQMAKNAKPQFGELKMTVAQFFRINGGTTQLRGVKPDILFPAAFDDGEFGESSYDNALPWVQIKATDYSPVGDLEGLLPILSTLHEARVKSDPDFRYLNEDIAAFKLRRKKNLVSLNEAERREERDLEEARLKSRKPMTDAGKAAHEEGVSQAPAAGLGSAAADDGLQADERKLTRELATEKRQKDAKDVLLIEAVRILGDEVGVLKSDLKLASRVKARSVVENMP